MPRGNSFASVDGWRVVRLLSQAGWEQRNASSDHVIMSKAGQQQIVIRPRAVTHEAVVKAERALGFKITGYRPERTISEQVADRLVALGGGGARFEKEKPEVDMTPELTVHKENGMEPDVDRPHEFDHGASKPLLVAPVGLTNESDQAALVRLAKRRLERLDVEFQQVQIRYQQLQEQHTATVLFLESLGIETGGPVAGAALVEPPKRTVLPYAGPKTRRPHINSAIKDKIRMAFIDAGSPKGYGWIKKVQDKLIAMGVKDIPDHVIGAKSWA